MARPVWSTCISIRPTHASIRWPANRPGTRDQGSTVTKVPMGREPAHRRSIESQEGEFGVGVVVPAAGSGQRMGGRAKPFLELRGEPVLLRALRPFLDHPGGSGSDRVSSDGSRRIAPRMVDRSRSESPSGCGWQDPARLRVGRPSGAVGCTRRGGGPRRGTPVRLSRCRRRCIALRGVGWGRSPASPWSTR